MYVLGGWNQVGDNRKVFSLDLSKAEPKWVTVPPMLNHRRTRFTSVVYKDKLVVIGGTDSNFRDMLQCEQYDPSTRVWTEFAPLNRARYYSTTATVHNERIYFAGGYSDATVEMYDPESNQWKLIAPMNIERIDLTLVNYLDQVLAVGGLSAAVNSIESYNPTTNSWAIESVSLQPNIYQGVQLNEELLVTGQYGGLYTIRNLGPNARVVQLSSPAELLCSSVAVVSSRLAVAFYKP